MRVQGPSTRRAPRLVRWANAAILLVILFWLGAGAWAQIPDEREELLRIEAEWNEALRTRRPDLLEAFLDADFELYFSGRAPMGREAVLASVRAPGREILENGRRDQQVRVYGGAAVVTGVYHERGRERGRPYAFENRYTYVYVLEARGWRAVSAHVTRIFTEPPASTSEP